MDDLFYGGGCRNTLHNIDRKDAAIPSGSIVTAVPDTGVGQLIDKHGHLHCERSSRTGRLLPSGLSASVGRIEVCSTPSHTRPPNKSKSFMTASCRREQ
jgi:hypothetical protein